MQLLSCQIVHASVHDEVVDRLKKAYAQVKIGNPLEGNELTLICTISLLFTFNASFAFPSTLLPIPHLPLHHFHHFLLVHHHLPSSSFFTSFTTTSSSSSSSSSYCLYFLISTSFPPFSLLLYLFSPSSFHRGYSVWSSPQ